MRLSDVNPSEFIKVLAYGESGTGKTCFAAGFPTPIKYLDFDGKVSSAAKFYSKDKDRLDAIDVENLAASLVSDPIEKLLKVMAEIEVQAGLGKLQFKTLVIDSLTTFSSACLKHIVKTNPAIKRVKCAQGVQPGMQDYGILKREFARLIPGLLSLPCNVVMLGHIQIQKDEVSGEILRLPALDGSFASELNIYFEEVYRTYVQDGKYLAQTITDYKYKCRTQRGLPKSIPLEYQQIANT